MRAVAVVAVALALACGPLPATRSGTEEALGLTLPRSARGFTLEDVNVGLYDMRTDARFWISDADRDALAAELPCALAACGGGWACGHEGGHDVWGVRLAPRAGGWWVTIEAEVLDNNVPERTWGCDRS